MTTYTTIKEAFSNGTGDVFFTKNNRFIAVCRKDDNSNLIDLGFKLLSYDEVTALAVTQTENKVSHQQPTIIEKMKSNLVKSHATCDGYYDEFPDAYGQCL